MQLLSNQRVARSHLMFPCSCHGMSNVSMSTIFLEVQSLRVVCVSKSSSPRSPISNLGSSYIYIFRFIVLISSVHPETCFILFFSEHMEVFPFYVRKKLNSLCFSLNVSRIQLNINSIYNEIRLQCISIRQQSVIISIAIDDICDFTQLSTPFLDSLYFYIFSCSLCRISEKLRRFNRDTER